MGQKIGVKKHVLDEIIKLAQKYDIRKVILFGSRARGDYKERSDIDLAVSGGHIVGFTVDIDDSVQTLLMFDIVNLDEPVQEELKQAIEREGKVIYEKI